MIHLVLDQNIPSHRSYVVNPENVIRVDKANHTVYFENGESCFVSRMKLKGLVERIALR